MADENEQLDEIMALQSIYEDGTFICDISDKPITGNIFITIETDADELGFTCNGDLMSIKHLTPLVLNFSFPSNYPSVSPPNATLSCLWLTSHQVILIYSIIFVIIYGLVHFSHQLEMLSHILREKWAESCSVVLFTWIEFLRTEVIELLGITFPIDISEDRIMKLKEYNVLREEELFNRNFHSCPVCFLDKPGSECVRMPFCKHVFCKECLSGFLSVYIQEGTVHSLNCPYKDCDEQVNPHIIKMLVSQSDFERYDRLMLQNTLDVMSDVGYCPRIKCQKPVIVDKNDHMGYCHACKFAFCTKCNMTYHGIDGCLWERGYVQQRFRMALKGEDESPSFTPELVSGPERKFKRSDANQAIQTKKWLNSFTKPCPSCGINIEKTTGCNLMTCSRCQCKFCWSCLEMETVDPDGYYYWPNAHGQHGCGRKLSKKELKIKEAKIIKNAEASKDKSEEQKTNLVTTDLSDGQSLLVDQISGIDSKIAENPNPSQTTSDKKAINLSEKLESQVQEDQENKTESWINSNTKKCPKCSIRIEKWMGCNRMACTKCGYKFCWLCLQKLINEKDRHYDTPSMPCFRKQFVYPGLNHRLVRF